MIRSSLSDAAALLSLGLFIACIAIWALILPVMMGGGQ